MKVTKPELVDDGGDTTLGRHKGAEREDAFAGDGLLPDPANTCLQHLPLPPQRLLQGSNSCLHHLRSTVQRQ